MNDEIKAILADLNLNVYETKEWKEPLGLNQKTWKMLLDYITNLQEQLHQASLDIQELTERDIECPSWCDKLTNLQQENQDLSRMCELYGKSLYNAELTDYKSRIEKAVEYIKRFDLIIGYYDYNDEGYDEIGENNNLQEELLNILNGRSDE